MRNPETTEVERETVLQRHGREAREQGLEQGRREALLHVVRLLAPRDEMRLSNLTDLKTLETEVDRLVNRVAKKL